MSNFYTFTRFIFLATALLIHVEKVFSQVGNTQTLVNTAKATTKPVYSSPFQLNQQEGAVISQLAKGQSPPVTLKLDQQAFDKMLSTKSELLDLNIPLDGSTQLELELVPVNIFAPDFKLMTQNGRNKKEVTFDKGTHWQGVIKGASKSFVALSWIGGQLQGVISDEKGVNRVISKTPGSASTQDYMLFVDNTYNQKKSFSCGVVEPPNTSLKNTSNVIVQESVSCKVVDIYFEADYAMYQKFGSSTTSTANYVTSLFNQVATLYRNENLAIRISGLTIWTNTDPYAENTSTSTALTDFRTTLNQNFTGQLAHLLSTRSLGGGIAYVDVLCAKSYAYGVSAIDGVFSEVPTFSWDVMVIAHELGHNFGSLHTQSCTWPGGPIDNCVAVEDGSCNPGPAPVNGGTIMSYCHLTSYGINLANGFGPLPGNLIRANVQANSCLSTSNAIPSSLSTSNIYSIKATLNWVETGSNSTYTLDYRQQGATTWTSVTTTSTKYILTGLSATTTYEWRVKGDCSVYSSVANFTTNTTAPVFCTPSYTSNCSDNDGINGVTVNGTVLSSASGCSPNGYKLFSNPTLNLVRGQSYSFTVNFLSYPDQQVAIWIDLNQDYEFQATELLFKTTSNQTGSVSGTITIPANALLGSNVRMRVRDRWSSQVDDPCALYTYGEAEDYSVNIVDANCTPTLSSNSPLCSGGTLNLSATGTGSFSWSGPNSFSSTGATPSVVGVTTGASGVYTVQITSGTCTATASVSVVVNATPSPNIAGTTSYCAGQTISLTASGGTTYSWAGPNSFVATTASISKSSVSTTDAGVYSVTAANGSCTASSSVSVVVNATPSPNIAGTTSYCTGQTISLTASGGTAYSWSGPNSFSATTSTLSLSATSASAGVYSLVVSNGSCTASTSVSVVVNATPSPSIAGTTTYCTGQTISLTASGGTTYSWAGPNSFASTLAIASRTNAATTDAGVYVVTAANGSCTASSSVSVVVNATPSPSIAGTTSYCTGQTISLTASGGTTYSWSGPNSFSATTSTLSLSATSASAGVYSLIVSNGSCTASTSVSVAVNSTPTPNIAGTTSYCTGQTISLTASGGTTYSWSGPNSFASTLAIASRTNAATTDAGVYVVTAANGSCTASSSVSVVVNTTPSPSISGTTSYCTGQTISLTASGGATYSWSGPNGFSSTISTVSISATSASAGVYSLVVSNSSCTASSSVSVLVNSTPSPSIAGTTTYCTGQTISLTASGGTPYSWSGPNSFASTLAIASRTNAATTDAGVYVVTAANGSCTASSSVSVVVNATPSPSISGTTSYCTGQTISLTASGGATYSWSGPNSFSATTSTLSLSATSASAGVYSLVVSNGSCTASTSVSVVVNATPSPSIAGTTTYCTGQTISLTASGGTTYSWSGPNSFASTLAIASRTNAATTDAGVYILTAANGSCTASSSASVVVNATPSPNIAGTTSYCAGQTISLTASGGATYSWSGPNGFSSTISTVSISATSASAGVYSLVVSNGSCTASTSVSVVVNSTPSPSIAGTTTYCTGQTISLTASGGTTYSWAGPNSFASTLAIASRTNAATTDAGVYILTAANGSCTASSSVSVVVNTTPSPSISGTTSYCTGQTISLTASGGATYSWSGPNSFSATTSTLSLSATSASAGVYSLVVSNGSCTASTSVSVVVNATPSPNIAGTTTYCTGQTLSLTASGGSNYSWTGPNSFTATTAAISKPSLSTSDAGIYSVTVANGSCTASASTSITINNTPLATIAGQTAYCTGGTISLTASGGSTYSWRGPGTFSSTTATISRNATSANAGGYSVTVSNGTCTATNSVSVQFNTQPTASISGTKTYCTGQTITLTAANGASYFWAGPNGFSSSTAVLSRSSATTDYSGTYTVTVANGNCTATASTTVTVNTVPTASITGNNVYCVGATITLTASGGATYSWRGPGNFSSTTAAISRAAATTAAGVYSVTAYNGTCSASQTISVVVNTVSLAAGTTTTLICSGQSLSLTATGGHTQYAWAGPAGFSSTQQNPVVNNLTTAMSGNYTVSATATCGVVATSSVKITVKAAPTVTITSNSPVCIGSTLKLTSTVGSAYAWSGPGGFSSIIQKPSFVTTSANNGIYSLTVTSTNSCSASSSSSVVVQNCTSARVATSTEGVDDVIQLQVAPNPTRGQLEVTIKLQQPDAVHLMMSNAMGQVQHQWQFNDETNEHSLHLDLSAYPNGMYFFIAETKQKRVVKKVLKIE
ncbi:MAG: M12 family metallo-peptidase [Spirosomataceae bacterium]